MDTIDKAVVQMITTAMADAEYIQQNEDFIMAFDEDDPINAQKLYFKNLSASIRDMIENVMGD